MTSTQPPSRAHELDPWSPPSQTSDAELYRALHSDLRWLVYREIGDDGQCTGWVACRPNSTPLRAPNAAGLAELLNQTHDVPDTL